MRIMVAPDKFKGSLSSRAAAEAIGRGLGRALPQAKLDLVPVADGGDGTAETIVHSLGGQMIVCDVHGPDGKPVQARYGLLEGSKVAVIELAQASGRLENGRQGSIAAPNVEEEVVPQRRHG